MHAKLNPAHIGKRFLVGLALAATMVSGASAADLTTDAKDALQAAINDEYHAEAVYNAVIAKFGQVRPFSNIVKAERQHQSLLIGLYDQYGLTVPANPYTNGEKTLGELPATLSEACQIGVTAEIANRALYAGDLLPKVAQYTDITAVLNVLSDASEYQHLPAFQRCAR
ncbi:MAG: ferritin-like domain-containing protein [Devosia sp.]